MKKLVILLAVLAVGVLFSVYRGEEVKPHTHPYHPAPVVVGYECPEQFDTCPYAPYEHEHEGYSMHRHEYNGEYE